MELEQMMKNIDDSAKAEKEEVKAFYNSMPDEPETAEASYEPVDIYQRDQNARWEESKKVRPKGSSVLVKSATASVIDGDGMPGAGLAHAYKRAEDDSDSLKERGEVERADMARKQYMDEKFIPAVETVVNYTSPDELLNCKEALDAFDKYALGVGTPKGYTAAYIRQAYGNVLGQDLNGILDRSDDAVRSAVCRIKMLADQDQVSTAIGVAKQIKKSIDSGEHIANDDDYAIIGRVAAFGN